MTKEEIIADERYHTCDRCKYSYIWFNEYPCNECVLGKDNRKYYWEYAESEDGDIGVIKSIIAEFDLSDEQWQALEHAINVFKSQQRCIKTEDKKETSQDPIWYNPLWYTCPKCQEVFRCSDDDVDMIVTAQHENLYKCPRCGYLVAKKEKIRRIHYE